MVQSTTSVDVTALRQRLAAVAEGLRDINVDPVPPLPTPDVTDFLIPVPDWGTEVDWSRSGYKAHAASIRAGIDEAARKAFETLDTWQSQALQRSAEAQRQAGELRALLQPRIAEARDVAATATAEADAWRQREMAEEARARAANLEDLRGRFDALMTDGVDRSARVPLADVWASTGPTTAAAAAIARIGEDTDGLAVMLPVRSNVVFRGAGKESANVMRSWVLRLLASRPPGLTRVRFADPTYMGNSLGVLFGLLGVDLLAGTGVAVTDDDIAGVLESAQQRVAQVNTQVLRGRHSSIDDFNRTAPVPEYQLVVAAFGLPGRWTAKQIGALAHLAEMGPACGVSVLASVEQSETVDKSTSTAIDALCGTAATAVFDEVESYAGTVANFVGLGPVTLDTVSATGDGPVERWLENFSASAADALAPSVGIDHLDTTTQSSSADGLVIPIGVGANETVSVTFGDDPVHGLVVGGTGSGKTTMLHTLIHSAAQRYSPDELELWLIDLKEGVEFRQYANDPGPGLPHARVVACASDPEFALAAMDALVAEGRRRGELFRAAGVRGLAAFRSSSDAVLPRILCVIDECHILLGDRRLGSRGWSALSWLAKEGRAFGIHVLLATQSLAGMGVHAGETASVWRQVQMRLALKCHQADAHLIFGDNNTAAHGLASRGDGVLNNAFGDAAANIRLQVAHTPDDRAREIRDAQTSQWGRRWDQISFTGDELAVWTPDVRDAASLSITLGRPLNLGDVVEVPVDDSQRIAFIGPSAATTAALRIAVLELRGQRPDATFLVLQGSSDNSIAGRIADEVGADIATADEVGDLVDDDLPDVIIGFDLDRLRIPVPETTRAAASPPLAKLLSRAASQGSTFLGAWSNIASANDQSGGSTTRPVFTIRVDCAGGAAGPLRGLVTFHPSSGLSLDPCPFIPWAPLETEVL